MVTTEFPRWAWRISRDHLATRPGDRDDAGTEGPRDAPESLLELLRHPKINSDKVHAFRILDDDGELYYTGYVVERVNGAYIKPMAMDAEAVFSPLDDFGAPNAGATEIQYRTGDAGAWETM